LRALQFQILGVSRWLTGEADISHCRPNECLVEG
jgi:hypothetical protein